MLVDARRVSFMGGMCIRNMTLLQRPFTNKRNSKSFNSKASRESDQQ
jgi:hypothetical protein